MSDPFKCQACGGHLTLEDMKLPACRFCNTMLPHQAQRLQGQQMVNQMMQQQMQAGAPYGYGYIPHQQIMHAQQAAKTGMGVVIAIVIVISVFVLLFAGGMVFWLVM
jgi:uncharacterized membrane protein YvbJ